MTFHEDKGHVCGRFFCTALRCLAIKVSPTVENDRGTNPILLEARGPKRVGQRFQLLLSKLDKLLHLRRLPRRGTSQPDSSNLELQEQPVWDSPNLVELARMNDKLLARATESSPKPMAKKMSRLAKAWSLSYWITNRAGDQ